MNGARLLATLIVVVAIACDEPPATASTAIVTIESESAYRALPVLALDDLGSACGVNQEACAKPSFQMAAIHPEGAVAFWGLDGKRPQLFRTAAGRVLPLGRQGGGPGEYRMPYALGVSDGGDVLAADLMQRRVLRYGTDGRSLSTASVPLPPGLFDLAFVGGELRAFATAVPSAKGDSLPVRVFALDSGAVKPRELFVLPTRQPAYNVTDMRPVPQLFAAHARFQFRRDGHLFVTIGTTFLVDEFDATGTHVAQFGFDVTPREVTERELESARQQSARLVSDPMMRQALESAMRVGSARHPAVTRVVPLDNGGVWLRESPREAADSVQWIVFNASARPLGRIVLAASEMVLGSYDNRLLVSREDEGSGSSALRWMRVRERR